MNTGLVTYSKGSKAFLIGNNQEVLEVTILSASGGLYKVKFTNGAGTCVKQHRLYQTEQEAQSVLDELRRRRRMQSRYI